MRGLSALLLLVVLTGCGKAESVKSAEAQLVVEASALCKQARPEEEKPQLRTRAVPAARKLRALLYADARLPKVKVLLADGRAIVKAREHYEHPSLTSFAGTAKQKAYWLGRERIGFKAGGVELKALGLSICDYPATEALLG